MSTIVLRMAKELKINGKNRIGTSYYETLTVKMEIGPEKGNHELSNDLRGAETWLELA